MDPGVFFAAVVGAEDVEGRGSASGFMGTLCLAEAEIAAFHSALSWLRAGWHLNLEGSLFLAQLNLL